MTVQVSDTSASQVWEIYTNLPQQYLEKMTDITNAYLKVKAMADNARDRWRNLQRSEVEIPSQSDLHAEQASYFASYRKLQRVCKENDAFEKTLHSSYQFLRVNRISRIPAQQLSLGQLKELENYASSFKNTRHQLVETLKGLKEEIYHFHLLVENRGKPLSFCQLLRSELCSRRPKIDEILSDIDEESLTEPVQSMEVEAIFSLHEDEKEHKAHARATTAESGAKVQDDPVRSGTQKNKYVVLPDIHLPSHLRFRKKEQAKISTAQPLVASVERIKCVLSKDLEIFLQ